MSPGGDGGGEVQLTPTNGCFQSFYFYYVPKSLKCRTHPLPLFAQHGSTINTHDKLTVNSYFEDRRASRQQAASCRLRGKQLRPKKVGQSLPRNGGRGRRSCSSHWHKTQLEIPTSLTPGCIRSGAENGLQ